MHIIVVARTAVDYYHMFNIYGVYGGEREIHIDGSRRRRNDVAAKEEVHTSTHIYALYNMCVYNMTLQ